MTTQIKDANKFGPLSEERLRTFEKELGCSLPADYREFLLTYNGGRPEPSEFFITDAQGSSTVQWLYGLHDEPRWASLQHARVVYEGRLPPGFLAIGNDEGGNLICMALGMENRGAIYFWDHEAEGSDAAGPGFADFHRIAKSFPDFLRQLTAIPQVEGSAREQACQDGNLDVVQHYLDAGGDPNLQNEYGHALAITAAMHGQVPILETLIAHGADITGALSVAAQNGQAATVDYLLSHGAQMDQVIDARGDTPLMRAASFGYPEIVEILIKHGANVNAKNRFGQTALAQAAWADHRGVVDLLRAATA